MSDRVWRGAEPSLERERCILMPASSLPRPAGQSEAYASVASWAKGEPNLGNASSWCARKTDWPGDEAPNEAVVLLAPLLSARDFGGRGGPGPREVEEEGTSIMWLCQDECMDEGASPASSALSGLAGLAVRGGVGGMECDEKTRRVVLAPA